MSAPEHPAILRWRDESCHWPRDDDDDAWWLATVKAGDDLAAALEASERLIERALTQLRVAETGGDVAEVVSLLERR